MSPSITGNRFLERDQNPRLNQNAIRLENLPQPSVEARKKLSRGTPICRSITNGIHNGTFECIICYENIGENSQIWHCGRCWGVYHYQCVLDWASGRHRPHEQEAFVRTRDEWVCPSCRDAYWGCPLRMCCKWSRLIQSGKTNLINW